MLVGIPLFRLSLHFLYTKISLNSSNTMIFKGIVQNMDRTGLDWTGLDWTGLDWTVGLDWTGLFWNVLHLKVFILGNFTYKCLPVISYSWPFVSKWVRDIWVLIQCIFFTKHFKRVYVSFGRVYMRIFDAHILYMCFW